MTDTTSVDAAVNEQIALAQSDSTIKVATTLFQKICATQDGVKRATRKTDLYAAYIAAKAFCTYYDQLPD